MKILYLEDNPADADLTRRGLLRENPRLAIEVVTTLQHARQRIEAGSPFDVLLLDLALPDGSGLEILAEVRQNNVPAAVVVLTSKGDEETALAALKAGADDYVAKTAGEPKRLLRVLELAFDRFRTRSRRRALALNILYAEHSDSDRDLTARHFASQAPHITLKLVSSAAEALALLPQSNELPCPFDVILVDYRMPGETGLDLLKILIEERCLKTPIVLVTGQGDEEVAALALRLGAADYLVKFPGYINALPMVLENAHYRASLDQSQAALQEKTLELENFFRNAVDLLCIASLDGHFLRLSNSWESVLGYSITELEESYFIDFVHPDDKQATLDALAALQAQQPVKAFINRYMHKDGTFRRIEWKATPVADKCYAVARDMTERLEAERIVRETQEWLQRAVSAGNVGLWDWDLATNRVYYSPEWRRQISISDNPDIRPHIDEFESRVHPDDLEPLMQEVQEHIARHDTGYSVEFRFRHDDGSYRWIIAQASILFDEAGRPIRVMGTHVDITERKRLEEQFLQAQKMESIGRLAGGVAHDFNNLLSAIIGYSDLILEDLPPEDRIRPDLEQIRAAGDRAAGLTKQLLAFSRRQVLQPKVVALNELVSQLELMLRRLIGEHIQLSFLPGNELGHIRVDPLQMEQVIMNLAVNARDAMPLGGNLRIETCNANIDEYYAQQHVAVTPGRYVMLSVSDSGSGIAKSELNRIFDPFYTTKEIGKGTGLGLSTVYGIVQQSHGHIFVYSELGKGTTFKLYFPRCDAAPEAPAEPRRNQFASGKERILVVEDDPLVRELVLRILGGLGYAVTTAEDGADALQALTQAGDPFHLLLTDVIMPGLSGRELAREVIRIQPSLHILFMSGYTDDTILHHGVLDKDAQFIAKPFTANDLALKVRQVLDAQPAAALE